MTNPIEDLHTLINQIEASTNNHRVLFAYSEAMAKGLRECLPGYEVKMVERNFEPKEELNRNYLCQWVIKEYCPRCNTEISYEKLNRNTIICQNCDYKIKENK